MKIIEDFQAHADTEKAKKQEARSLFAQPV